MFFIIRVIRLCHASSFKDREESESFRRSGNAVQAELSNHSALLYPQGDGSERTEKSLFKEAGACQGDERK